MLLRDICVVLELCASRGIALQEGDLAQRDLPAAPAHRQPAQELLSPKSAPQTRFQPPLRDALGR